MDGERLRRVAAVSAAKKEAWKVANEVRDQVIAEYDQAGWSVRRIAAAAKLHPSTVHTVIAEQAAIRQARTRHALHMDEGPVD